MTYAVNMFILVTVCMAHCLTVCVSVSQPLPPLALRHCLGTQQGLACLKHRVIGIIDKLARIELSHVLVWYGNSGIMLLLASPGKSCFTQFQFIYLYVVDD